MDYRYHTADVFTNEMFGGNPLAVFPEATGITEAQMMSITREFNYSETVFVFPASVPAHSRRIRIFTPGSELPFAGHPTVGTAFVLAATGEIPFAGGEERIVFEEGVGPVPVLIRGSPGKPTFTQLTVARLPERADSPISASEFAELLGLAKEDVLDDGLRPEIHSCGVPFLCIPIRNAEALSRARVRSAIWDSISSRARIPDLYLITHDSWQSAKTTEPVRPGILRARMFGPGLGIPEDPATGGAAAALSGFLTARAAPGDSTLHWTILQGVEMGRASKLELEVERKNGTISSVHVGGESVLVSSGTFYL